MQRHRCSSCGVHWPLGQRVTCCGNQIVETVEVVEPKRLTREQVLTNLAICGRCDEKREEGCVRYDCAHRWERAVFRGLCERFRT